MRFIRARVCRQSRSQPDEPERFTVIHSSTKSFVFIAFLRHRIEWLSWHTVETATQLMREEIGSRPIVLQGHRSAQNAFGFLNSREKKIRTILELRRVVGASAYFDLNYPLWLPFVNAIAQLCKRSIHRSSRVPIPTARFQISVFFWYKMDVVCVVVRTHVEVDKRGRPIKLLKLTRSIIAIYWSKPSVYFFSYGTVFCNGFTSSDSEFENLRSRILLGYII